MKSDAQWTEPFRAPQRFLCSWCSLVSLHIIRCGLKSVCYFAVCVCSINPVYSLLWGLGLDTCLSQSLFFFFDSFSIVFFFFLISLSCVLSHLLLSLTRFLPFPLRVLDNQNCRVLVALSVCVGLEWISLPTIGFVGCFP